MTQGDKGYGDSLNKLGIELRAFHNDERGHISVLLLFSIITLVCLIALIFNTGYQTSQREKMQLAAESASLAGGTIAARGMNAITANNNRVAEILATMIAVRSALQTAEIMSKLDSIEAAGYKAFYPTIWIGVILEYESKSFKLLAMALRQVDSALSRSGWPAMQMLDLANVSIKAVTPIRAVANSIEMAKINGADRSPHAWLFPGEGAALDLAPILPVARGKKEEFVDRAEAVQLKPLKNIFRGVLAAAGPLSLFTVFPNQLLVFEGMLAYNKSNLRGRKTGEVLSSVLRFIATPPLAWSSTPPRPMLLSDEPSINPMATMETKESEADLAKVRKYLQYLAVAAGKINRKSPIGGEKFPNIAPFQSLSYSEADLYNPSDWSTMRSQDWRVKLASSVVLNQKAEQILGKLGFLGLSGKSLSFVNNH